MKPFDRPDPRKVLAQLKGFQRDAVEFAFHRLYGAEDSTSRFLVADEVGLGKTLIARGIVAKAIDYLWDRVRRIDVIYICSNLAIAKQNVRRLNLSGDPDVASADRITMLPAKISELADNKVNFISFTPATSFDLRSSQGVARERRLLYWMMQSIHPLKGSGPKNLFQGWVERADRWRKSLKRFREENTISEEILASFERALERRVRRDRAQGKLDLLARYEELCDRFGYARKHIPREDRKDQSKFIGELRSLLARTCVDALEPDLVILDEFQRYWTVMTIPVDSRSNCSNTPMKKKTAGCGCFSCPPHPTRYTRCGTRWTRTITTPTSGVRCRFSTRKRREAGRSRPTWARIVGSCIAWVPGMEVKSRLSRPRLKHICEGSCRVPRGLWRRARAMRCSANVPRPMLSSGKRTCGLSFKTRRIAESLESGRVVEYWKSAPYLINLMDGYELDRSLRDALQKPEEAEPLARLLSNAQEAQLPWDSVQAYEPLDPPNARLRSLFADCLADERWKLLWLPPTLPYWRLGDVFERARESSFTKRLVFSAWQVVPKAVAMLLSYEVERAALSPAWIPARKIPLRIAVAVAVCCG